MTHHVLHQFLYRGWNVSIRLERQGAEGPIGGRAELRQGEQRAHRIVVDEPYPDGGSALRQVAQRARSLVDGWQLQAPASYEAGAVQH